MTRNDKPYLVKLVEAVGRLGVHGSAVERDGRDLAEK